jgi:hypothetical protein
MQDRKAGVANEEKKTGVEPIRTRTVGQEWTTLPRQENKGLGQYLNKDKKTGVDNTWQGDRSGRY